MMMFYALVTLCMSGNALAQIAGWGPCPEITPMPNFDLSMMAGRWYEASRYFAVSEFSASCVVSDFRRGQNGTMIVNSTATSILFGRKGSAENIIVRSPYSSKPGMLKVKVPGLHYPLPNYLILGTDYKSYVVGYVCVNMEIMHLKMLWIGTRDKNPSKFTLVKPNLVVRRYRLNPKYLMKTDQTDCEVDPYEPENPEQQTPEPVTAAPHTTEPVTTEPHTTEPETTEPHTTEPETTESQTTDPETNE